MDKDILKIDLDCPSTTKTLKLLKERLSYMHDINFLKVDECIKKIVLIHKSNWSVKIFLTDNVDETLIIILQLMLGSDYRKEINTMINHYRLNMEYSNRLFDIKRYKGDVLKDSKRVNVTKEVLSHVLSDKRKTYYN